MYSYDILGEDMIDLRMSCCGRCLGFAGAPCGWICIHSNTNYQCIELRIRPFLVLRVTDQIKAAGESHSLTCVREADRRVKTVAPCFSSVVVRLGQVLDLFACNINSDCLFVCRVSVMSRTYREGYVFFWGWAIAYAHKYMASRPDHQWCEDPGPVAISSGTE